MPSTEDFRSSGVGPEADFEERRKEVKMEAVELVREEYR